MGQSKDDLLKAAKGLKINNYKDMSYNELSKAVSLAKKTANAGPKVGDKVTFVTNGHDKDLGDGRFPAIVSSVGTDNELDLKINSFGGVYSRKNIQNKKSAGRPHWIK